MWIFHETFQEVLTKGIELNLEKNELKIVWIWFNFYHEFYPKNVYF